MAEHDLVERAYKNLGPWSRADENGHLLALLKALLNPLLVMDDTAREGTMLGGDTLTVSASPSLSLGGIELEFGGEPLSLGGSSSGSIGLSLNGFSLIQGESEAYLGWGSLLDVNVAPEWALPWLAQFVGVRTIADLDVPAQRLRIKGVAGFHRGTPASIIAAAKQYLTGSRRVELYEREGSPWVFRLRTYAPETPDPDKVREAVEAIKPAGVVFIYELQSGIEIDGLSGTIDGLVSSINSYNSVLPA